MKVRVASAQINVTENINRNLQKILEFIERAKSEDAEIVCFPEVCLNPKENGADVSGHIAKVRKECREKSIWCIFGSYFPAAGGIRNSAFLINRSGRMKYRYDKVNIWVSELGKIAPGKTNRIINTEFGKIGIITCWDFAFPSYIQKLSRKGAKIIFCPSYLVDSEEDADAMRVIPLTRAFENLCYFVSCDAFAEDSLSESYICHPLKVLKSIRKKEGLIFADLDLDEIDDLRKYYNHLE